MSGAGSGWHAPRAVGGPEREARRHPTSVDVLDTSEDAEHCDVGIGKRDLDQQLKSGA